MKPEPYETIPLPAESERLATIAADLADARYHLGFLDGDWDARGRLLNGIIDAQAALRQLSR